MFFFCSLPLPRLSYFNINTILYNMFLLIQWRRLFINDALISDKRFSNCKLTNILWEAFNWQLLIIHIFMFLCCSKAWGSNSKWKINSSSLYWYIWRRLYIFCFLLIMYWNLLRIYSLKGNFWVFLKFCRNSKVLVRL